MGGVTLIFHAVRCDRGGGWFGWGMMGLVLLLARADVHRAELPEAIPLMLAVVVASDGGVSYAGLPSALLRHMDFLHFLANLSARSSE